MTAEVLIPVIAGLLGVLVGGVITYWLQRSAERRDAAAKARTAARVLDIEMRLALSAFTVLAEDKTLESWKVTEKLKLFEHWRETQATLASVMDADSFRKLAGAITNAALLVAVIPDEIADGAREIPKEERIDLLEASLRIVEAGELLEPYTR